MSYCFDKNPTNSKRLCYFIDCWEMFEVLISSGRTHAPLAYSTCIKFWLQNLPDFYLQGCLAQQIDTVGEVILSIKARGRPYHKVLIMNNPISKMSLLPYVNCRRANDSKKNIVLFGRFCACMHTSLSVDHYAWIVRVIEAWQLVTTLLELGTRKSLNYTQEEIVE